MRDNPARFHNKPAGYKRKAVLNVKTDQNSFFVPAASLKKDNCHLERAGGG
ncbi:hypothetical protein [Bacillus piscicola]|uniref:hypothetical protein n=1 Tax=Bacillus piscicola TaxID=1632684 RepID=UPI001F099630|nr:hypothetical protein [Bacillus piscicola]